MALAAFLISLIVVGIPAALLKVIITFATLRGTIAQRGKVLARSIGFGAISGFAAILIYFGLPIPDTVLLVKVVTIPELAAATALVSITIALDMSALSQWRVEASPSITKWRRNVWLLGSNLWIPWALVILFAYGSGDFHAACRGLDMMSVDSKERGICEEAPRRYWSEHSMDYVEAQRLDYDD